MAKINILPAKVYNRIAAGEVVDRPASVVKELLENSIDAGATEIEIHIEQGGKQLIRVVDNGCGIERDDLQSAFLPHATSKISKAEDLESIATLGFRGEAIASIASVSQMTITSKTEDGNCYKLSCNGGELGQITETSGQKGTDVCVELLFYHTPVRLSFLKSDKVEESEITNLVSRFILNHSDVAFTYYADNRKVMQSFGGGDEEAMVSVYGASTLAQCFCVNAEKHGVKIRGYIGSQNFYKPNKSYQSIFLNGRYIVNAAISSAISSAYSSYLMKRQYPFYALHIDVPTEVVDVNVHPNKADVRFANNQLIYGCVYSVIAAVLDGQSKGLEYVVKAPFADVEETPQPIPVEEKPKTQEKVFDLPTLSYEEAKKEVEKDAPILPTTDMKWTSILAETYQPKPTSKVEEDDEFAPIQQAYKRESSVGKRQNTNDINELFPGLKFDSPYQSAESFSSTADNFAVNKQYLEQLEREKKQEQQEKIDIYDWYYAGKLFNTYLLYQYQNTVYIIDQHAAHERLIYNHLKEQLDKRIIIRQPMLVPYKIQLNAYESAFIRSQMHIIQDIGFDLEETEDCIFSVTQIPLDLQNIDLDKFFHRVLSDMAGYKSIRLEELIRDKLASDACKAAVKAGMDLTREEVDRLFALMDGDMGLKCPHGRPVVVKMTKTQLEKLFKRIV